MGGELLQMLFLLSCGLIQGMFVAGMVDKERNKSNLLSDYVFPEQE